MPRHLADEKVCVECYEILPLENFIRNKNRKDGYMGMCKACQKTYVPKHTKRNLDEITKSCGCCGRTLSARMFVADQTAIDKLASKCRSCKAWRAQTEPSLLEVELYETEICDILQLASERVDDPARDRALYENFVAKLFHKRGLDTKWKLPIWVNNDTLLD